MADDDGDLWVSGRVDDMINTGGENVYPDEIEAALVCCPAVADVVVVGLPDERWGQAVTAFVVPAADVAPGEAVAATRRLGPPDPARRCERPKRVVAVDAVPRSAVGKTLRRVLVDGDFVAARGHRRSRVMTWTPARDEDAALVSGAGRFVDDLDPLPGTLVAAIVRSPHPHARIRGVDLARARAHPGVAAVIGPEEVGAAVRPFPLSTVDAHAVPAQRRRHRALRRRARRGGRGRRPLRRRGRRRARRGRLRAARRRRRHPRGAGARAPSCCTRRRGTNVATDRTFSFGPVDDAFARADHVVHGEYTFPRYSSVPMECYGVVAHWRDESEGPAVECWANFHGPFTMVPVAAGCARRRRSRGSGCTCRPTSAAASASSRASTPTSC